MDAFCNDFHGCPPLETVGREGWVGAGGGGNMTANARGKEGEANQMLDVLYRWQGGGTKSS